MNHSLEKLLNVAIEVEAECYFPPGRLIDGAPYTCLLKAPEFCEKAIKLMGGYEIITNLILKRQETEHLADANCGNWILWTILNEMEVSREKT
ncbi:MAG: hypothetical protein WAV40_01660 [Microgenomates group bacterium]